MQLSRTGVEHRGSRFQSRGVGRGEPYGAVGRLVADRHVKRGAGAGSMGAQGPLQYREAGFEREPVIDHYLSPLPLWSAQWVPSAWTTRNMAVNETTNTQNTLYVPADVSSRHEGVITEATTVSAGTYASEGVYPFLVLWFVVFAMAMLATAFWFYQEADSISRAHAVKVKSKRVPATLAVQ